MSLLARAHLFAGIALVLTLLLGALCLDSFHQVEHSQKTVDAVVTIWNEVAQLRAAGLEFTLSGGERARTQIGTKLSRLKILIAHPLTDADSKTMDVNERKLRLSLKQELVVTEEVFAHFPTVGQKQARSERDQRTFFLFNQSILGMTTAMFSLYKLADEANSEADRTVKWAVMSFVGLLSATYAIFVYWLRRQVLLPVSQMHSAALAISAGDHSAINRLLLDRSDELGDLSKALSKAVLDLEESNRDLESFSYSVSHDLRAPLRAIDGFLAILQSSYADKLDAEGQRLFGIVCSNAQRMGMLIDDILALSRAGRLDLERQIVDMGKLVHEVWASLCEQDTDGQVQFEFEPLPHISGDPRALRQVWQNLLANARKFSHDRTTPIVRVSAIDEGSAVRYSVTDNGVGFNQEYAGKLFTLFQRLHGMNEFEGTGVGLAIVKRFVRKHGGEVTARGALNEGATFSFTLPKSG